MEIINLSMKHTEEDLPEKIETARIDLAKIIKSFRLIAFAKRKL